MLPFCRLLMLKKGRLPKYGSIILRRQSTTVKAEGVISNKYNTIAQIRNELIKNQQVEVSYLGIFKSKEPFKGQWAKSQDDLPVKKMKDSFDIAVVPLSTDVELRNSYITYHGHVRVGKLMEDIDLFAVWCCKKHLSGPGAAQGQPNIVVTIRVDHIELMKSFIQPTKDIRLSGHVCWVGKSSFEIVVWLEQEVAGKWEGLMNALLLMAARNPIDEGPLIVNKLEAETAEERELQKGGEERKLRRLEVMRESLLKKVPTEKELCLIHNLFIETMDPSNVFLDKRVLPPRSKWMEDATLNNILLCHPEYRNLHNKVFGGFLIRQALELSWSVSYIYGMRVPRLIHISDITFHSPVDVGSLLKLKASVTYAERNFIQVSVYAEAFTASQDQGENTTSFNFTYDLTEPSDSLYPSTYLEAMKYIDGRRHFYNFVELESRNIKSKAFARGESRKPGEGA